MAHLIRELYLRLEAAGRADAYRFSVPLTQADLGDILGLTDVHVNRVMMELRQQRLIKWKGAHAAILDWDRLVELAQFDAAYLRLQRDPV